MKIFKNWLITWLLLQLAIGPVFFFIINLTLQRTILDWLVAVTAVTIVDYFYITLAVLGIGKLLQKKKFKKIFWIISSIVLITFGIIIIKNILGWAVSTIIDINSTNLLTSFTSVFLLTISSPMTIVWYTSLFTAKAVEYNYAKRELIIFGLSVGLATLIFMGTSVILFSLIKGTIPITITQILNWIVWWILIIYGWIRLWKIYSKRNTTV